jgi:hypothetical protein
MTGVKEASKKLKKRNKPSYIIGGVVRALEGNHLKNDAIQLKAFPHVIPICTILRNIINFL